jgi:hypothetical protein
MTTVLGILFANVLKLMAVQEAFIFRGLIQGLFESSTTTSMSTLQSVGNSNWTRSVVILMRQTFHWQVTTQCDHPSRTAWRQQYLWVTLHRIATTLATTTTTTLDQQNSTFGKVQATIAMVIPRWQCDPTGNRLHGSARAQ